jgi:hypothetical protein
MSAIFESTEYVMAELIRGVLKNALAVQLAAIVIGSRDVTIAYCIPGQIEKKNKKCV